ncbi:YdcF family protein [Paraburkholderia sp. B3]|uniref:YdcF family protein n=1 Tax=Paraburkholderia sp. B3 TaxID=3134791 RepID=UPI003981B084
MILFVFLAAFLALFVLCCRARVIVAAGAIVFFWLLASGWLTGPLLDLAQPAAYRTPYDPAKPLPRPFGAHTAIVVLGGGTHVNDAGVLVPPQDVYPRLATAASLYARCRAAGGICRVIVSGGNPQHHAATEADTYAPYLLRAGVARSDLVLENASLTTWQNARNVTRLLQTWPDAAGTTLLLVTSAYQMPRALLDFRRDGNDPLPVVSGTRVALTGWRPRLANLESAQIALHELIGIAQFHVYCMIGWF